MATQVTCPRTLTQGHSEEEVVVKFPKSLTTRCGELWTLCVQWLWDIFRGLVIGCGAFWLILGVVIVVLAMIAFYTVAYLWIPAITNSCHKEPGLALTNFTIRDMAPLQSVGTTPDSPWRVNSAFDATFSTWNRNTVTKCFTTYRRMDVRVEYKGQVILQQQFPLVFSLKPRKRRPFSIEMKSDHGQLTKDLGAYMQAELRSDNITLNFFYSTRYLIADRRSKWKRDGCVVVVSSRLGTVLTQDCFSL